MIGGIHHNDIIIISLQTNGSNNAIIEQQLGVSVPTPDPPSGQKYYKNDPTKLIYWSIELEGNDKGDDFRGTGSF